MEPDRWVRLEDLFRASLERAPGERRRWLGEVCSDDPDLRQQVEALLEADEGADELFEEALRAGLDLVEQRLGAGGLTGSRLGAYRLDGELGRGATSTVYVAHRADGAYEGRAAVKVLRRGMVSEPYSGRFRSELQILARLDHPGIARLLDAGTTPDGRPYFVLEHVNGQPIDLWAEARKLSLRRRLELFQEVADAVAYAHRNLVIHRDLKPSNILVTDEGHPKLLDFGIAELVEPPSARDAAVVTDHPRTPSYASPEQVLGRPLTTGTDVYSLGVVLYRLLAGRHPYRGRSRAEIERSICSERPPPPSRVAERGRRQLAGDLDAIVGKALAKDPDSRYASVGELAEDLRCHLENRPVTARRSTLAYRLGKLARRNRAAVAVALLRASLVSLFALTTAIGERRAARERDKAKLALDLLVSVFEVAEPERARGATLTAREVLDRGAARLTGELEGEPEVRATLLGAVGRVYARLGLYDRAEPLLAEAASLARRTLDEGDPELAGTLSELADVRHQRGEYAAAEALYREALGLERRRLGEHHPRVAELLNHLADVRDDRGDFAGAASLYRRALALRQELLGAESPQVAESLNDLAVVLHERGDYAAAEPLYRQALELRRRLLGEDHPAVAESLGNLASLLQVTGREEEAERLFRQAVALDRRVLGDRHPELAGHLQNLAMLLLDRGDIAGAESSLHEAMAIEAETRGTDEPNRATNLYHLGLVRRAAADREGAEVYFRRSIELYRRTLPPGHPFLAFPLLALGRAKLADGEGAAALPLLREAVAIRAAHAAPRHWRIAEAEAALGECLAALGRVGEARSLLARSLPALDRALGEDDWRTLRAAAALASLGGVEGSPSPR